jgi:Domain of unknown function (DUF397)
MTTELSGAQWRKSSYSNGQANCVEVAGLVGGEYPAAAVRDSKRPGGARLIFSKEAWRRFTETVETITKGSS